MGRPFDGTWFGLLQANTVPCCHYAHVTRLWFEKTQPVKDMVLQKKTVRRLLFECRQLRHQRNKLYKDLGIDGLMSRIEGDHP